MGDVGAILNFLHRPDLGKASAKGTHSLRKMLARTAHGKTRHIFLPAALDGRIKRVYILAHRLVSAVAVNFGQKTPLTERSV